MNYELGILKNFIRMMPKVYRKRTRNWLVVRDILLSDTQTAGSTSCYAKCMELGIKADSYSLDEKV